MLLADVNVTAQRPMGGGYRWLELEAPDVAAAAMPGQFVHLRVPSLGDGALRRPFSICEAESDRLAILYKDVGRGTAAMTRLVAGDRVSLIGPLGQGFPLDLAGRRPMLVAGGYGVAPLLFLARRLVVPGVLMVGGRTSADVLLTEEFEALDWEVQVATQDGSRGVRGLVTDLLDNWLAVRGAGGAETPPVLYACGPDGLLRAVGERAEQIGCDAWLSLDKHMVCGVGACLACVQTLRRPDGSTWIARVCRDGPVFDARTLVWGAHA